MLEKWNKGRTPKTTLVFSPLHFSGDFNPNNLRWSSIATHLDGLNGLDPKRDKYVAFASATLIKKIIMVTIKFADLTLL